MWPIWCSFSMACLQSSPMKDHIVLSDTTSYIIRDRTEKNNELRLRARKVVCHWSKNGYNAPRRKSQDQQKSAYISDIFKTHDISFEQSQKKPCAYGWDEAFAVVYSKISHAQLIAACKVEQNDLPNPYFCPYLRRLVEFVNRQKGRRWKVVHPPKTLTKRGPLLVVNHEVSVYMWSLSSIQRPSRMYALPRYTILYIFTITVPGLSISSYLSALNQVSEQPYVHRLVVQALSSPKSRTYG